MPRGVSLSSLAYCFHYGALGNIADQKTRHIEAMANYKKVLNQKHKDQLSYMVSIGNLAQIYELSGDIKMAKAYNNASREYWDRFHTGDVMLARRGVNDLISKFDKEVNKN